MLDDNCREQLLIIAQLGAIGSGDLVGATQIKEQFGEQVPVSNYRYAIRGFLLAWAEQGSGTGPAQRQVVVARVRPQAVTRDGAGPRVTPALRPGFRARCAPRVSASPQPGLQKRYAGDERF